MHQEQQRQLLVLPRTTQDFLRMEESLVVAVLLEARPRQRVQGQVVEERLRLPSSLVAQGLHSVTQLEVAAVNLTLEQLLRLVSLELRVLLEVVAEEP